ncbi:hypothetical protein B0J12DRAFT_38050 [Macrophomina phaseolina]|uniref:Uncharacterized protein n=1 Tax=Macrophomina phaseolina TaxID=35725 RepID=A0ABQ8GW88_9PEZI|nr:hypothetical protein B0J12DRAFT_38050 [Macrophomina phaseolina]
MVAKHLARRSLLRTAFALYGQYLVMVRGLAKSDLQGWANEEFGSELLNQNLARLCFTYTNGSIKSTYPRFSNFIDLVQSTQHTASSAHLASSSSGSRRQSIIFLTGRVRDE